MRQLLHCLSTVAIAFALSNSFLIAHDDKPSAAAKVEFRRAEKDPADGLIEAIDPSDSTKIFLHKKVELDNKDAASARYEFEPALRQHAVVITFTEDGAKKMAKLTKQIAGKQLAILLDGKVVSAPMVRDEISKMAIISNLKWADVDKIVKAINGK